MNLPILGTAYDICPFMPGLFHLAYCLENLSTLWHVSELHSLARLKNILLCSDHILFVYPFILQWTSRWFLPFVYCEYCCCEHWSTSPCFQFFQVYTLKWNCWFRWQFYYFFLRFYLGDPWVAQQFSACLWPRPRSWRPGIESHIGLPVHGACFSLCLCLCLSLLSLCDCHK